jgi:undecaprenyl diphosphate synthase
MKNIPKHIVIIPDGNRRWARKKGLPPWHGHQAGAKTLGKILLKARDLKIPYFTFWAGSWDNLTKRPKIEIDFLFKLYTKYFKKALKDKRIHQNKVKINVFGRWKEIAPKTTQKAIEKAIDATKNYNNYFLTLLIAYDGRDEMIDCIQRIANLYPKKKITPELIKKNLWTKDLPPVDLVIRTGCEGDPHLSAGFMMWDTAYSQLYFTKTLFPDFGPEEFEKIIEDYAQRQRRFGK